LECTYSHIYDSKPHGCDYVGLVRSHTDCTAPQRPPCLRPATRFTLLAIIRRAWVAMRHTWWTARRVETRLNHRLLCRHCNLRFRRKHPRRDMNRASLSNRGRLLQGLVANTARAVLLAIDELLLPVLDGAGTTVAAARKLNLLARAARAHSAVHKLNEGNQLCARNVDGGT
jgi:hypothetical protein